jgi:hypothetical protein
MDTVSEQRVDWTSSSSSNIKYGHIGIGKLVQNLAVAAAETILLTGLFLAVDVPEMLWTRHVEKEILHRIVELIG